MKNTKGVTTTSLIIYVIAMLIVIGIIATITSFYYTNVMSLNENSDNIAQLTKFQMYFLEETQNQNNQILKVTDHVISFASGNTYQLQDNGVYRNQVKITDQVKNLQFKVTTQNEKQVISVLITLGEQNEYTKTMEYVMKK